MVKSRKNKSKAIIIILAVIVLVIGSAIYLALWNKTPDVAEDKSFNLIDKLRTLQVNGGTLELTEDEVNSTLRTLVKKPIEKGGVIINGAFVNIGAKAMTLFAPIKYKGLNLLPNITGSIAYENDRLIYEITSVKIGKLGIPKSILLNKLKGYSNDDVVIDGSKIEISKFLLPFNAKNIYLSDNKIFADIAKLTQVITGSSGGNSNTTKQGGQSSGTSSNKAANNANKTNSNASSNQTPYPVYPTASQVASLNKVSTQLNGVIADVKTDKEKQMIKKIQTVVKEVAENPNYSYQSQANEVKAWYSTLQPSEKSRLQDAVISNVNVTDILKLINIFGI